jgi:hypothetical protein
MRDFYEKKGPEGSDFFSFTFLSSSGYIGSISNSVLTTELHPFLRARLEYWRQCFCFSAKLVYRIEETVMPKQY